jgi:hypothetical protein
MNEIHLHAYSKKNERKSVDEKKVGLLCCGVSNASVGTHPANVDHHFLQQN